MQTMTAAAYIRVSTEDQTEYSPNAQINAIKSYCQNNKIILLNEHIYIDEGISGRKAEKRPAFMKMVANAKSKPKPFDLILVHKFDRFARNREDSVVYKAMLRRDCDVRVISITENIEDDKFSVILEAMLEAMAEYYSLNLSDEVKKGMTQKHSLGQPQTSPPFGYDMKDGRYVVNELEANCVKQIFEKFNNGESYLGVMRWVNSLGFTTKRNSQFQNRNIEYILQNVTYIGCLRWNPSGKTDRRFNDVNLVVVEGEHEAVIDKELFESVQIKIKAIKQKYGKFSKNFSPDPAHWLVRQVKCGNCGANLVKSSIYYLGCTNYAHQRCNVAHYLNIKKAEKVVFEKINKDLNSSDIIKIDVNKAIKAKENSQKEIIQLQAKSLNQKLERVKLAYENGVDTIAEYNENKKRLLAELNQITTELDKLEQVVDIESTSKEFQDAFRDKLRKAFEVLKSDNKTNIEKQHALNEVISKIIYRKDTETLEFFYAINV